MSRWHVLGVGGGFGMSFCFCWVCRVGFLWGVGGGMMVIDQVI